tara:strand:- start:306 stop:509 length:204 start_codon:yes stop_codon:yes gene_type:complete
MTVREKCICGKNMYEYTDGEHLIFLCYVCGRFEGVSNGDEEFTNVITKDPMLILEMIDENRLTPTKL